MPRRKKLPPVPDILGIGKTPENHMVLKANPLVSLSETGLTLAEFKILDAYLARIDSHKPEERFIRLEKGEIEKYLGVTQIKPADLEKRIDNLFQTVTIRDKHKPRGFTKIALFEKAVCYQDDDGFWQVDLGASASAMDYIFSVENIGFLRYRLRNVINLTSRYSYVLYLYFEQNRNMHLSWEIPLEELKSLLQCTAERYSQFKFFNSEILKKCQKELNEKTDCHFSYEPIRKGRKVSSIRFTLEPLSVAIESPMPDQLTIADYEDLTQDPDDPLALLSAACDDEFSREQMDVLLAAIATKDLPPHPDGLEFARYHYLQQQYAMLNVRAASGKIKHRFEYLLKMIQNDKEGKSK